MAKYQCEMSLGDGDLGIALVEKLPHAAGFHERYARVAMSASATRAQRPAKMSQ